MEANSIVITLLQKEKLTAAEMKHVLQLIRENSLKMPEIVIK